MKKGFVFRKSTFTDFKNKTDMKNKLESNAESNKQINDLESGLIRVDIKAGLKDKIIEKSVQRGVSNDVSDVITENDKSKNGFNVSEAAEDALRYAQFKKGLKLKNLRKDLQIEIIYGMAGVGKTQQLAEYILEHTVGTYRVISPTHSALNTIYSRCLQVSDGRKLIQESDFKTVHSYFQIDCDSAYFICSFDPSKCTTNDETIFIDEFSLINKYLFRNCLKKINSAKVIKKVVLCGDIMQLNAVYDNKFKIGLEKLNMLNNKWNIFLLQKSKEYGYDLNKLNAIGVELYENDVSGDISTDTVSGDVSTDILKHTSEETITESPPADTVIDDVLSSMFSDELSAGTSSGIAENSLSETTSTEPASEINFNLLFEENTIPDTTYVSTLPEIYSSELNIIETSLEPTNTTPETESEEQKPIEISSQEERRLQSILKSFRPNNIIYTWSLYPEVIQHYHLSVIGMRVMRYAKRIILKTNMRSKNNVLKLLNAIYSYDYNYPYEFVSHFDLKRLIKQGYIFIGSTYDILNKVYCYATLDMSTPLIDLERNSMQSNIRILEHFNKQNAEIELLNENLEHKQPYTSIRIYTQENQKNPVNIIQLTYNDIYICTYNDPNGKFRNGDELRFKGFCLDVCPAEINNNMSTCKNESKENTETESSMSKSKRKHMKEKANNIDYMYSLKCINIYTGEYVFIPLCYVIIHLEKSQDESNRKYNRKADQICMNINYIKEHYGSKVDTAAMILKTAFYPITPNNIITFHRSQGKTLNKVIICIDNTFDLGMIYTGVTRAVENVVFYTKYHDKLKHKKDFCDLLFNAANVTEFVQLKLLIECALNENVRSGTGRGRLKGKIKGVGGESGFSIKNAFAETRNTADIYSDLEIIKDLF